jgi:exonuclease 3'-5' domain-containing protein 1
MAGRKEKGLKLFTPESRDSYEVFNARPLSEDAGLYCAQDVQYLPRLCSSKLSANVLTRLRTAADDRVKLSQTETNYGHGRHMALGPWRLTYRWQGRQS